MRKDTIKIVEELALCPDFHTFYDDNKSFLIDNNLPELLDELMKSKQLKKSQVIQDSELSDVYAYQIFSGLRMPDRKKLICLAIGMHLSTDELQTLLKQAGYPPLYAKRPFDAIIMYGFDRKLSIIEINSLLYKYDLETIG